MGGHLAVACAGELLSLFIAGVIDSLQYLFAAIAADALAVLARNLPAPAAEEAGVVGGVTAQAENAAIIIDLLAVVGVVGDAGRADEVDARPTRRPDIDRKSTRLNSSH